MGEFNTQYNELKGKSDKLTDKIDELKAAMQKYIETKLIGAKIKGPSGPTRTIKSFERWEDNHNETYPIVTTVIREDDNPIALKLTSEKFGKTGFYLPKNWVDAETILRNMYDKRREIKRKMLDVESKAKAETAKEEKLRNRKVYKVDENGRTVTKADWEEALEKARDYESTGRKRVFGESRPVYNEDTNTIYINASAAIKDITGQTAQDRADGERNVGKDADKLYAAIEQHKHFKGYEWFYASVFDIKRAIKAMGD